MRRAAFLALVVLGCGENNGHQLTPDGGGNGLTPCDVFSSEQDCRENPARPKCTLTTSQRQLTIACVGQLGTLGNGESCMRGLIQGEDDCDLELFCSGLGAPADDLGLPVTRACRRFCTEDEMCDEGQRCITLIPDPRTGLCVPSGCVLFDDSCPTNTACDTYPHFDSVNFVGACRAIGSVGPGGDCGSNECAAGNRCYAINPGVFRCFPLCDENHLCETGTCQLFPGMPNLAGICLG